MEAWTLPACVKVSWNRHLSNRMKEADHCMDVVMGELGLTPPDVVEWQLTEFDTTNEAVISVYGEGLIYLRVTYTFDLGSQRIDGMRVEYDKNASGKYKTLADAVRDCLTNDVIEGCPKPRHGATEEHPVDELEYLCLSEPFESGRFRN